MSRHVRDIKWHHHRIARRGPVEDPTPVLESVDDIWTQSNILHARAATSTCKAGDDSPECELPAGAASKLPLILGAAVPILVAVVVLLFLHRRHMRKLKEEEQTDKTKSMDFGMGNSHARMASLNGGEKMGSRSRKQMSMDLDTVISPYLMPNGLNGSHDTLHSISRTVHSVEDRYGLPSETTPRSPRTAARQRDSSMYTRSTRQDDSPDGSRSDMDFGLLNGAQKMPTSSPPRGSSLGRSISPVPQIAFPPRAKSPEFRGNPQERPGPGVPSALKVGSAVSSSERSGSPFADPIITPPTDNNRPNSDAPSEYGGEGIQFRFSDASIDEQVKKQPVQSKPPTDARKSLAPAAMDGRRLSMGSRPLPPDANPEDTAEERAMRIRSFYKEYFSGDEITADAPPMPAPPARYQDEYRQEFNSNGFDDTTVFDSETGRFIVPGSKPFAEPVTRRAMTPPPRAPPRFMGPAAGGPGSRSRAGSAAGGRMPPPGPRSFSSASGHPGQQQPRRPMAPPKPLNVMPTPSMLNEDAFNSPHMFAPPVRVPREESDFDSGRGGLRPYSPAFSPHVPLASAFEDLPSMPSPHALRKSTAFTALDFAPPKKFKNEGEMSDAGSIHSTRSGVSQQHTDNIRNGAYRVSRLPTDVVPLKDDMTAGLRPTWDLGYGKSG
ncbi:hypothetical protein BZA05DRAFT_332044 [Tricharina praecox]|uniref:uncharacterized protein n=1 Tax=Tricharina praecox TaxID=43433 RepID=UPI00222084C0|nr:uncharacterized protein BZA05DRAFT_332044 [Tricharina praecox]KAI5857104.1 hypothetical protein BZA05DRAFT_332044 [Tricharina praecox]